MFGMPANIPEIAEVLKNEHTNHEDAAEAWEALIMEIKLLAANG